MQQTRRSGKSILGLMAIAVLAGTALTAGPAQAVSSNGPYYATPSWDQKLPASTRFVVLSDWASAAVLDRETGLVWEQSPAGRQNWSFARIECTSRRTGGRKGWRLPSVHELASLIDPSVPNPGPTLPLGHPFTNVLSDNYMSATTNAEFPTTAWFVDFSFGGVLTFNKASGFLQVWCVRGGMNADTY